MRRIASLAEIVATGDVVIPGTVAIVYGWYTPAASA